MNKKDFDLSKIRGRVLWLVYYCIENKIQGISAKSHFIKKCGLGNSFVSDLENNEDQTPTDTNLRKIVTGLGVNEKWLYHNEGNAFDNEAQKDVADFETIPFYPNVRASAGSGLIAENEEPLDIVFRSKFIKQTLRTTANSLFAMKVHGESMEPDIKSGDLIIVDQSRTRVQGEKPYVVVLDEQVLVKELHVTGKNEYTLVSRNKNERYTDRKVNEDEGFFRILGEVRHIQRTI